MATRPGRYTISSGVKLEVTRITEPNGEFRNEATILWFTDGAKDAPPSHQHPFDLPDGTSTFVIVWKRGGDSLWISDGATLRRVIFNDPANITFDSHPWNATSVAQLPKPVRDELEKSFPTEALDDPDKDVRDGAATAIQSIEQPQPPRAEEKKEEPKPPPDSA